MKKLFFILIIFSSLIIAQDGLNFSLQIRPRFEIDNKDFNSTTSTGTFTAFRTRLGLTFNRMENLTAFFQIQDSRYFGDETSTTTNSKNIDLHQAFFKIDKIFTLPVDLKLGRFEMAYGSQRFIGPVDWNNIGRSFDGGLITFNGEQFKLDLFAVREFEKFNSEDSLDQNVYGLVADLMFIKSYKIQPFLIWQRVNPTNILNRATLGIHVKGELDQFYQELDFGYQTGSATLSNRSQDINAYTFSFGAGYNFELEVKPTIGAQIDIASGDDNSADNDYKSYTSLYGTGHKFFGYMDYFINFPNDTYGLGLTDIIMKAGLSPINKLVLALNYHLFNSMEDYKLADGTYTNSFGSEIDFVATYKYNNNVAFEGGASFFFPGDIFKEKRGKDNSAWFYLMAIANL